MNEAHQPAQRGPATATSRIAPVYLIPLLAAAHRAKIGSELLFQGLGLVADDLEVPGFAVSPAEGNTIVRRALRLLKTPDLGLQLGMDTRITERGAMALGLMAAATLGDAIALTLEFPGSAGYLMAVRAERLRNSQRMVAEPLLGNEDISPFLVDIMFAGSVRIRRQVTEASYAPTSIELTRPRPANAAVYEKYFACPVRFGRDRNIHATDQAWLDYPLPMANAMAYRLSRQLLTREFELPSIPAAMAQAVERAIQRALPLTVLPADVARSLNLSERTLRRRLAQEGHSFRDLLDEARKARALQLMSGAKRRVTDIAMQTGFADVRAFSRAFRRWTGTTPSALLSTAHPTDVDEGNASGT